METKNKNPNSNIAIAFPVDKRHKDLIMNVLPSLRKLYIKVFIVDNNGNVDIL